jgi:hypothetical protein
MKQKSGPDSSGRTSSEEHSASDTPFEPCFPTLGTKVPMAPGLD